MNEYIKSDLFRYTADTGWRSFIRLFLKEHSFRVQVAYRLVRSGGVEKLLGMILWLFRDRRFIVISRDCKIGYGFYIGHGGPIVINHTAQIGNNVNISQFATIGANDGKAASIGDNVYIGPNVCIVENVRIGNNVTIGAGSVVTKDIPENATVVGNYAKVVNYNNPARYINNRWVIKHE